MHIIYLAILICSVASRQLDFYPSQGYQYEGDFYFAGDTIVVKEASGQSFGLEKRKGPAYKSIKRISYPLIFKSVKPSFQTQLEPGKYVVLSVFKKKTVKKEAYALIEYNDAYFIIAINNSIKNDEVEFIAELDLSKMQADNISKTLEGFTF